MNNIIDEIDRAFAAVNEPSGDHEKDGRLQMLIEQHWPSLRDRLREAKEVNDLVFTLSDILTRTADSLKGKTADGSLHSWHDLPERASALAAKAKAFDLIASREISVHSVSRMDTPYGFCWTVRATPYDVRNITHPDLLTAVQQATREAKS